MRKFKVFSASDVVEFFSKHMDWTTFLVLLREVKLYKPSYKIDGCFDLHSLLQYEWVVLTNPKRVECHIGGDKAPTSSQVVVHDVKMASWRKQNIATITIARQMLQYGVVDFSNEIMEMFISYYVCNNTM